MLQQIRRYGPLLVGQFRPQWPKVVLLAALLFGNVGLQLATPLVHPRPLLPSRRCYYRGRLERGVFSITAV